MKKDARYLVAAFTFAAAAALLWGGYGQQPPDSLFLYAAGALLGVAGVGIATAATWSRSTWAVVIAGAAVFALYRLSLPMRPGYGPVSPADWVILTAFALAPLAIGVMIWSRLFTDDARTGKG